MNARCCSPHCLTLCSGSDHCLKLKANLTLFCAFKLEIIINFKQPLHGRWPIIWIFNFACFLFSLSFLIFNTFFFWLASGGFKGSCGRSRWQWGGTKGNCHGHTKSSLIAFVKEFLMEIKCFFPFAEEGETRVIRRRITRCIRSGAKLISLRQCSRHRWISVANVPNETSKWNFSSDST